MTKKFGLKSSSRTNFNKQGLSQAAAVKTPSQSTALTPAADDLSLVNHSMAPAELDQLAKVKWNSLQSDLANALGSWNELSEIKDKSPEEKQLEKVKTLIEDLKSKLNEF